MYVHTPGQEVRRATPARRSVGRSVVAASRRSPVWAVGAPNGVGFNDSPRRLGVLRKAPAGESSRSRANAQPRASQHAEPDNRIDTTDHTIGGLVGVVQKEKRRRGMELFFYGLSKCEL